MTEKALHYLKSLAPTLKKNYKNIALLSPCEDEINLFEQADILTIKEWNLNEPYHKTYDLIIVSHVLMYAKHPKLWINHLFDSCKTVLVLDIINRQRQPGSELGTDNDQVRYKIKSHTPKTPVFFDLDDYENRLIGMHYFEEERPENQHFIAFYRGNHFHPKIRIDDFPTGVRPILPDIKDFYTILDKFESEKIDYYLGIVPAILDQSQVNHLKNYNCLIPSLHGFDHHYFKYAPKLEAINDPLNQKGTIQGFDEFKFTPTFLIRKKLALGKNILEHTLEKKVTSYIPPNNIINNRTIKALKQLDFESIFSEKKLATTSLKQFPSNFYGKTDETYSKNNDVICLHMTWEYDVLHEKGETPLNTFLETVKQNKASRLKHAKEIGSLIESYASSNH